MNTSFTITKAASTPGLLDTGAQQIAPAARAETTIVGVPAEAVQPSLLATALPLFAMSMGAAVNDAATARPPAIASAAAAPMQEKPATVDLGDDSSVQASHDATLLPAMSASLLTAAVPLAPSAPAPEGNPVDTAAAGAALAQTAPQPLSVTASLLSNTLTFRNIGQGGASAPAASDTRPALAAAAPLPSIVSTTQPATPATFPAPAGAPPVADEAPQRTADAPSTPVAPATMAQQMVAPAFAAPLVATIMPAVKFTAPAVSSPGGALPRGEAPSRTIAQAGMTTMPTPLEIAPPASAKAAPGTMTSNFTLAADTEGNAPAVPAATFSATGGLGAMLSAATTPAAAGDTIKLNGPAQQWQEPLREALGERLQTQIGRNSEHAVIRLDPPMLGRIEISIRHQAGALQVNLSASNTEVLRQLQGIGESMRNDLAQRQYTDVAVNINATPRSPAAQAFAEHDGRGQRQPGRQQDDAEPGRALSDGAPAGATFAMHEREYN